MSVTTDAASEPEALAPGAAPEPARQWLDGLLHERREWLWLARIGALTCLVGVAMLYAGLGLVLAAALAAASAPPSAMAWGLMATGVVLRFLGGFARDHAGVRLSAAVRETLRCRLSESATRCGPAVLTRAGSTAWWVQRHMEQVDGLHGYFARYLPAREAARWVPVLVVGLVLALDWIAGLLLLMAMPLVPMFMVLIGLGTQAVQQDQQERQASLAAELLQRLETLPWLRRVGALRASEEAVALAADGHRFLTMRVLRVAFLSSATLELFSALAIGLVALYVGFALLGLVAFGPAADMSAWKGLFVLMLAPEGFLPLRQLAQAHHDRSAALAAAESLIPLLVDVAPTVLESDAQVPLAFDAVTFAHPSSDSASVGALLTNLSFCLGAGEVVGLAGPSGSGKSTVLALAAGFLSPSSGCVRRASCWAWVAQRTHLFHGDLRTNLQLATSSPVDDDLLRQALDAVGLGLPHDALPQGLETPVGDGGVGVSGGQAQRIGVARALLSGATLWLLDEPTAALDEDARDRLLDVLLPTARRAGATLLIATHDSAVLARCDRVLDLASGSAS